MLSHGLVSLTKTLEMIIVVLIIVNVIGLVATLSGFQLCAQKSEWYWGSNLG